jgi:hypothetical protein
MWAGQPCEAVLPCFLQGKVRHIADQPDASYADFRRSWRYGLDTFISQLVRIREELSSETVCHGLARKRATANVGVLV